MKTFTHRFSQIKNLRIIISQAKLGRLILAGKWQRWDPKEHTDRPWVSLKKLQLQLPPTPHQMFSIDWIWFLPLSCAPSWCGGRSGSVSLSQSRQRGPVGTEGVHKRLMIDCLIGKRKIGVCQFQMAPWGRTGGDPGISAPEKPQAVNYMHQAMWRRGKVEAKKEPRSYSSWMHVFFFVCFFCFFPLFSSHLYRFAKSSWECLGPPTIPWMSIHSFPFSLWLK